MKKTTVMLTTTALIFCLSAFIAAAQTKPNLNGTWKMDPSKSKFANDGPDGITIKLDQKDASFNELLTIINSDGERTLDLKYTADGKETANQMGEMQIQVTAKWEGETFIVDMKAGQRRITRKITISADGKTMTMDVHRVEDNGEFKEKVVLLKQ